MSVIADWSHLPKQTEVQQAFVQRHCSGLEADGDRVEVRWA